MPGCIRTALDNKHNTYVSIVLVNRGRKPSLPSPYNKSLGAWVDRLLTPAGHFVNLGFHCCTIHGGMPLEKRIDAEREFFERKPSVMVATEAAGEGINLQFCSLNPNRLEQRMGRFGHGHGRRLDTRQGRRRPDRQGRAPSEQGPH